jgi:hypothetical protein
VNSEDLFTTEVASGRSRPLTHLPGREFRPSWSPDGENIAFIYAETTEPSFAPQRLRTIPARTETVRTAEQTHDLTDVSYTWHLPYMFFGRETPQWSPDSRGLLLFEKPYYGGTNTGRLVDLSGNTHKQDRFPPAATQIQWASNGTLVYVDNDQLWSIAFEPDSGAKGEPVLLWDGPAIYPSVSRDGSVLFVADDGLRIRRPDSRMPPLGWPLHYRVAEAPPPLLIQDVQIVSGSVPPGARSDILIQDGRIRRIAPGGTIAVEPGCQIIRGVEQWAIPGLVNLAAYLWEPAQIAGLLYHGVTTLQDMGSQIGVTADLRDSVEAGLVRGPRIFFVGLQFFPGADPSGVSTGDLWQATAGDSGAARGLALAKGFGASYAYIYQAETLEAALHLIRLAHASGLRVTYARFPPLSFIAAGLDRTEGLPGGELCYDDAVQLLRASGMSVVSDITSWTLFGYVQSHPAVLEEPETAPFLTPFLRGWGANRVPSRRSFYDAMAGFARKNVAKVHRGGLVARAGAAGVLPLPWAMHGEMEELVRLGLSPLEALQTAPSANARILGVERDIGTVEEGKMADLILLDADPLVDIRNTRHIHAVIQGGRLIDRKSLMQPAK